MYIDHRRKSTELEVKVRRRKSVDDVTVKTEFSE